MGLNVECPFCSTTEVFAGNELAFAKVDYYPVSSGHMLVIPRRHFADLFEATADERAALWELLTEVKSQLDQQRRPAGYNVGVNVGCAAGQTVMHLHVHLIPRYVGDMQDPRGGVRGVIPSHRIYDR